MAHAEIVTRLKALIKRSVFEFDPSEHAGYVIGESDRSAIILNAGLIEAGIVHALTDLMPTINNDERNRLFNYEGPVGSFSNRIRLAQALGIIDRPTRRRIEIVKEMRNVAAHSHAPITFNTPEIKDAVQWLFDAEYRSELAGWNEKDLRVAYSLVCGRTLKHMLAKEQLQQKGIVDLIRSARQRASHDK